MYGAIIGDMAGSIYEYQQTKQIAPITIKKMIENNAFYSDDTILTIAIADAILHDRDYAKYLKKYIHKYQNYQPDFTPYFKTAFSPGIIAWAKGTKEGTSCGNGAMMRISPIGFLFDNEKEVIENAKLATIPSHNSKQAIDAAIKIALIIFYLRKGFSKEEIFKKLKLPICYKPFENFNTTCNETINNCLYTFYNANNFEDAIIKTIQMGGDCDTNACIVGAMAEAAYGINDELINKVDEKLPAEFKDVLRKVRK